MKESEIKVGQVVRTKRAWCSVPQDTQGVIDELYKDGFMVAWNLPDQPLPEGYAAYDGRPAIQSGILRDGFDIRREAKWLAVVNPESESGTLNL